MSSDDYLDIQLVIHKYMVKRKRTRQQICKYTGMGRSTFDHKYVSPGKFRVYELKAIYDYLQVPQGERI